MRERVGENGLCLYIFVVKSSTRIGSLHYLFIDGARSTKKEKKKNIGRYNCKQIENIIYKEKKLRIHRYIECDYNYVVHNNVRRTAHDKRVILPS